MSEQPAHLADYQRRRREQKLADVRRAIARLDARGAEINYSTVAAEAGVDRSWLYELDTISELIAERRRQTSRPLRPRPRAERASEASLRHRLATALESNRQLRAENEQLRHRLAQALGEAWEADSGVA
jgi:cell division septum initiation protein DivIVA